jgi:hypothetical protein
MNMTKGRKIALFIGLVVVGLFFQTFLGLHCRCYWGAYHSRMIYGAMVVDAWVLLHLVVAAFRRRFRDQCIMGGVLIATSPVWIPIIFKLVLGLYLLPNGEPLRNLFHE